MQRSRGGICKQSRKWSIMEDGRKLKAQGKQEDIERNAQNDSKKRQSEDGSQNDSKKRQSEDGSQNDSRKRQTEDGAHKDSKKLEDGAQNDSNKSKPDDSKKCMYERDELYPYSLYPAVPWGFVRSCLSQLFQFQRIHTHFSIIMNLYTHIPYTLVYSMMVPRRSFACRGFSV